MSIEMKDLKLLKNSDATKRYVEGFAERVRKREVEFADRAKKQAPDEKFMNREYTI
jgi:hypothetical protein